MPNEGYIYSWVKALLTRELGQRRLEDLVIRLPNLVYVNARFGINPTWCRGPTDTSQGQHVLEDLIQ